MTTNQKTSDVTWKSQAGFIWSLIGSAVGFANILSFSAQVYKNGGGAFLIPYFVALFILGIPLLILEGVIGFKMRSPLVKAYGQVWGKTGRIVGWVAVLACLSIGGFYVVLTGYSVAYTYFVAFNLIPEDSSFFFNHTFLNTTPTISDFGSISLPTLVATLCVCLGTWLVLIRNIRDGIERICSVFMPMLALIMTFFALFVTFLPGGLTGWFYYLKPDFTKLADPTLWRDVFGQLFFSLSLGLGIIIGYSRHTSQTTNIARAMCYVALGDFAVSFISGAAIFGCLAHISYVQQVPFESILTTDSTFEIGFILFPKLFQFFGPLWGQLIGVIFFFSIFIAGITGVFSIVESIAGNLEVEFRMTRKKAVSITILAILSLSVLFCMGNASHLIDALAPMVMGTNMLIGGIALILAFEFGPLSKDSSWKSKYRIHPFKFCLRYIALPLLLTILVASLFQEVQSFETTKIVRWSWLMVALSISFFLSSKTKEKKKKTG